MTEQTIQSGFQIGRGLAQCGRNLRRMHAWMILRCGCMKRSNSGNNYTRTVTVAAARDIFLFANNVAQHSLPAELASVSPFDTAIHPHFVSL